MLKHSFMVWEFHMGIPTALLTSCHIAGDKRARAGRAAESGNPFRECPSGALGCLGLTFHTRAALHPPEQPPKQHIYMCIYIYMIYISAP